MKTDCCRWIVCSSNHDVTCETPSAQISWSGDGTQVAGACGNGQVIFAHVIEKRIEWRDYEATVTGRKTISLRNVTNDAWEKLEFRDRIIQVTTCLMENMEIFLISSGEPVARAPGGGDDQPVLRVHHQELEHPHHLRPEGGQRVPRGADQQAVPHRGGGEQYY